ncbi:MAG: isopentenyl-diphosphate delta-isomerase, type 2 [Labilithrix sp.]|nr:isopentenyl-diphosphate delta-isomerase, type 2 [Labilithrix sp.]
MSDLPTAGRKDAHIRICLEDEVEYRSGDGNGFGSYRFDHDALPEIARRDVSLETTFLGKRLAAPFVIGAMTGGTARAAEINRRLAIAATRCGVGLALGSQRRLLEDPSARASYAMKEVAPELPLLIGNIGAVQLNYGVGASDIDAIATMTACDAMNLHLNPLQEAIQPEGDTDFSGLLAKIASVVPQIRVPVLVKEVGSGISETTARKLATLPIAGVETAGAGGTSWSKIESRRADAGAIGRSTGELFARWGIPTAESIVACRRALPPGMALVASGGLRNGIEAAKALALGADVVSCALPMLKAVEESIEAGVEAIEKIKEELATALFLTGSRNVAELRQRALRRAHDFTSDDSRA